MPIAFLSLYSNHARSSRAGSIIAEQASGESDLALLMPRPLLIDDVRLREDRISACIRNCSSSCSFSVKLGSRGSPSNCRCPAALGGAGEGWP